MMRVSIFAAAFLSGAAVMSLEMAGFRLVQPEFGSDIVVWGSLISVFLGGLALGAWAGGWLADRRPALWKLGAMAAVAGCVSFAVPLYSDAVLDWTFPAGGTAPAEWVEGGVHIPPDMKWPTMAAGTLLFLFPAFLLGMMTPYAVKLFVREIPHLGAGVGKVSAVSTLGAIVGTLGTAFYLIAWMGTRRLFILNGAVLLALGLALVAANGFLRVRRSEESGHSNSCATQEIGR